MTSPQGRASIVPMKIIRSALPGIVASLCVLSAAALGGCASDDGTDGATGGTDGATGGTDGATGGTDGATGGTDGATGGTTATGGTDGATGGAPGTGGSGPDPNEMPTDTSAAGIAAFLAAGTYQSAPWVGDAAPRMSDNSVNVHSDELRVFFNTEAVAAKTNDASAMGTMIVKEMYEGGALVGHAVSLKTGSGNGMDDWTHYCNAPADSTICTGAVAETMPVYGVGISGCGFCHGQVPYAPLPQ